MITPRKLERKNYRESSSPFADEQTSSNKKRKTSVSIDQDFFVNDLHDSDQDSKEYQLDDDSTDDDDDVDKSTDDPSNKDDSQGEENLDCNQIQENFPIEESKDVVVKERYEGKEKVFSDMYLIGEKKCKMCKKKDTLCIITIYENPRQDNVIRCRACIDRNISSKLCGPNLDVIEDYFPNHLQIIKTRARLKKTDSKTFQSNEENNDVNEASSTVNSSSLQLQEDSSYSTIHDPPPSLRESDFAQIFEMEMQIDPIIEAEEYVGKTTEAEIEAKFVIQEVKEYYSEIMERILNVEKMLDRQENVEIAIKNAFDSFKLINKHLICKLCKVNLLDVTKGKIDKNTFKIFKKVCADLESIYDNIAVVIKILEDPTKDNDDKFRSTFLMVKGITKRN